MARHVLLPKYYQVGHAQYDGLGPACLGIPHPTSSLISSCYSQYEQRPVGLFEINKVQDHN